MEYIIAALIGYILGTSNMAYYISKLKGVDMRSGGSGNLGASNAVLLLGKGAGILTGAHDMGKAAVSVLIANALFPELQYIGILAGMMAVIGHIFPFWLKFKGGKGFASYLGVSLAVDWRFFLVLIAATLIIMLLFDYIVLATMSVAIGTPIYYCGVFGPYAGLIMLVASVVIIFKHRENFQRLKEGKEIGLRKALKLSKQK